MSEITFPWVSEGSVRKLVRAIELLRKEKKEITEEAIKELYIKWGGLVLEEAPAEEEKKPEEAPATTARGRRNQMS